MICPAVGNNRVARPWLFLGVSERRVGLGRPGDGNAWRPPGSRHREQRNEPPPIPIELPGNPRLRDIAVRDHDIAGHHEEDSEE